MLRKYWKWIVCGVIFVMLAILSGAFVAYYNRGVGSETLMQALHYIESGAIPDETEEFRRNVDLLKKAETSQLVLGAYKNLSSNNGVTYDSAMVLKGDGTYSYALTVGNETLHKTYQHSGRWWVEGNVFHTILIDGDLFLASPSTRDKMTPMREIIVESGENSIKLKAHFSSEPTVFERVAEVGGGAE